MGRLTWQGQNREEDWLSGRGDLKHTLGRGLGDLVVYEASKFVLCALGSCVQALEQNGETFRFFFWRDNFFILGKTFSGSGLEVKMPVE